MSDKWAMVVDVSLCINCHNCVLATKDEHVGNSFPGYSAAQPPEGLETIRIERHVRGDGAQVDVTYIPKMCNHCDDAPCIKATGGDGSISKRLDGIVIIDPIKARSRRDLIDACPYGMIHWNEAAQLPQHWTFDAHLLDAGWSEPRCVQACPTRALTALKASDKELDTIVATQSLSVLNPELDTKPRVFYRHLAAALSNMVCGNLVQIDSAGRPHNVPNVEVTLVDSGEIAPRSTLTNSFGDFKFSGLNQHEATIRISVVQGAEQLLVATRRQGSLNLGTLVVNC